MYLLYCALVFIAISAFSKYKKEWLILSMLYILLWCNKEYFLNTDNYLYVIRSLITFIAAMLLVKNKTKLGYYLAFTLFITMLAYSALAYDVAMHKHILIYYNYEAVIYGLVASQFIGIFPNLWRCCYSAYSEHIFSRKYNKGDDRI